MEYRNTYVLYTVSCELVMRTRDKKVSSRPVSRFPRQGILGVTLRVTIVTWYTYVSIPIELNSEALADTRAWPIGYETKDTTDKLNPISRIRTTYLIRDKSCLEIFVSPWDERELMSKSTYLTSIKIHLPTYLGVMKIKV